MTFHHAVGLAFATEPAIVNDAWQCTARRQHRARVVRDLWRGVDSAVQVLYSAAVTTKLVVAGPSCDPRCPR